MTISEYETKEIIEAAQKKVVERFREAKKEKNLRGKEMESIAGISKTSISSILNEKNDMYFSSFLGMCCALGIQPGEVCPILPLDTKSTINANAIAQKFAEVPIKQRSLAFESVMALLNVFAQKK